MRKPLSPALMPGRPYRILSIDGGGIRGLVPLVLMERLLEEAPYWLDAADLFAGTSTGGIIALGLAAGLGVGELRKLYEEQGRRIFDDSLFDNIRDLGSLARSQYDNRNLERELTRIFGETRLGDLKKRVLVPAFDLDNCAADTAKRRWAPKFFHNFPGKDSDGDLPCWKVAMYTSAAPTYFPAMDGFIDGGVFANNPAMAALAQTRDSRFFKRPRPISEIRLLSLGTGQPLMRVEGSRLDWGIAKWARPLVNIMMDAVSGVADYQCAQILGRAYHRLAPVFPPDKVIAMDAVRRIPELLAFSGEVDIVDAAAWLKEDWGN